MKITILIFSNIILLGFSMSSCNNKGCTDSTATNYDAAAKEDDGTCVLSVSEPIIHQSVNTFLVNDTVNFSTTGSNSDWSVYLGREGLNPMEDLSYYVFQSNDSISSVGDSGAENEKLLFSAGCNAWLFADYNVLDKTPFQVRKFRVGDIVDNRRDGASVPIGVTSARILEKNKNTSFNFDSVQYLGLIFYENDSNYYGWAKIKILNNYSSCIIESYSVSTIAGKFVTITE